MCLLVAVCISSLKKCLLSSSAPFVNRVVYFDVEMHELFTYVGY